MKLLIKYATPGSHLQQHRKTQGKKGGGKHICSLRLFFCSMNSSSIGNDEKNKTLKALLHFMQKSKGEPRRYRKKWERKWFINWDRKFLSGLPKLLSKKSDRRCLKKEETTSNKIEERYRTSIIFFSFSILRVGW
jgi:hypothetical protein